MCCHEMQTVTCIADWEQLQNETLATPLYYQINFWFIANMIEAKHYSIYSVLVNFLLFSLEEQPVFDLLVP